MLLRYFADLLTDPIVRRLARLEATMSAQLDALEEEVRKNRDVSQSVKALLTGLVKQIGDAKNDPVQIQRILDEVKADSADLQSAVLENTPADPPPSPVP